MPEHGFQNGKPDAVCMRRIGFLHKSRSPGGHVREPELRSRDVAARARAWPFSSVFVGRRPFGIFEAGISESDIVQGRPLGYRR